MAEYHVPVHTGSFDESDEDMLNEHVYDPGDPDGVIAAEKLRQWQESHPRPQPVRREEPTRKRRWPLVFLVLVLIAAASAGAYWLGTQKGAKQQQATSAQKAQQQAKQKAEAAVPIAIQTKHYNSTNFGLGFDYPANWTVNDTASKITVTSAPISLMTAVGSKSNASVVVTIENQQTSIAGFPAKGAVASLASDSIKYAQPSPAQRAQSNLSYLSYTGPADLDAMFLTGDKGYQQGQAAPMSDIVQGNPLISVGFEKGGAGSSDFVTLQASSWKSSQAAKAVTSFLESIVINS